MRFSVCILLMFMCGKVFGREIELEGRDAQVIMVAFQELGHSFSQPNPSTGSVMSLLFEGKVGGLTYACLVLSPGFRRQTSCRLTLDGVVSEEGVQIERFAQLTVVTITKPAVVEKIVPRLKPNPFISAIRASSGEPLLKFECDPAPEARLCRVFIAD